MTSTREPARGFWVWPFAATLAAMFGAGGGELGGLGGGGGMPDLGSLGGAGGALPGLGGATPFNLPKGFDKFSKK